MSDLTQYYPAYLLNDQRYDNPEACLDARGITEAQAQEFIKRAQDSRTEIIVRAAEIAADELFLVIAEDDGKWRTWAARSNAIRDTREQAEALVRGFGNDVEWRVFDIRHGADARKM
ncbi:MAG: hypothetical protein ACM3SS_16340 [Rhodospirillaceae bacterium]